MKSFILCIILLASFEFANAQIDSVVIKFESELEFPSQFLQLKSSIASRIDSRDNGYLYSANLVFGLGIYSIEYPTNITTVADLEISEFDGLSVSTLQQVGNHLYIGLGDFQTENMASGLAIINIADPENPIILDIWTSENFINGVSHLDVYDEIVYLSMMNDGLLILDAQEVSNIQYVSSFVPDLNYPQSSDGHHQGRGMTKVGDVLYYTFDRGGFRAIDVSDIYNLVEIHKYINTELISKATAAYNDVIVVGNYAYVSVDYCGLEVLDISSTPWTLVEWYDPVGCEGFNWFGAELHTNELITACNDSLLIVSGGNSEVMVFDISDPLTLKRIGGFFELDNELAAYGLHVHGDKISVSYINNPLNIPYIGNWGGLKILSFSKLSTTALTDSYFVKRVFFYPNPANATIEFESEDEIKSVDILSLEGRRIIHFDATDIRNNQIDLSKLLPGSYLINFLSDSSFSTELIIIN